MNGQTEDVILKCHPEKQCHVSIRTAWRRPNKPHPILDIETQLTNWLKSLMQNGLPPTAMDGSIESGRCRRWAVKKRIANRIDWSVYGGLWFIQPKWCTKALRNPILGTWDFIKPCINMYKSCFLITMYNHVIFVLTPCRLLKHVTT